MKNQRRTVSAATLTVLTIITAGALPSPAQAAGTTLTINAGTSIRPVTHVAAGGLYALAEGSKPADSTLLPSS
ncbi:hypothetical protein [Paractinoplanes durhamensis]|uniref:hypothetical protein n=1 Tax=Paractinoplanes durhamensis TaxID=113563 RepID=UPI00363D6D83